MRAILIPGANPLAAKKLFEIIKKEIKELEFSELDSASEFELKKAKTTEEFILIGKSMGGRAALEYELKEKDSKALILLAPAISTSQKYAQIKAPTLIIHGTSDEIVPITISEKLANTIPGARLIKIDGANHSYSNKEIVVAEKIKEWLKEQNLISD